MIVTKYKDSDGNTRTSKLKASDYKFVQWEAVKKQMFTAYSNSPNWTKGKFAYTMGGGNKAWYGPGQGTLTFDATGNVTTVSFNPKEAGTGGTKSVSLSESLSTFNQQAKKMYHSKEYRDVAFKETLRNVAISGVAVLAAPVAAEALVASPVLQERAIGVISNSLSQAWVNDWDFNKVNLLEVTSSAVTGKFAPLATLVGESVNVTFENFSQGKIFSFSSPEKTGAQVVGGLGSYAFGQAADNYLAGEGIFGKIASEFFKFQVETATNAAPNLIKE